MGRQGVPFKASVEEIAAALRKWHGNVAAAALHFGVGRKTIYSKINASAMLKSVLADEREATLDMAESVLRQRALAGNTAELLFLLRTQGGSRGYNEKQQIEHTGVQRYEVVYGKRPEQAKE